MEVLFWCRNRLCRRTFYRKVYGLLTLDQRKSVYLCPSCSAHKYTMSQLERQSNG